MDSQDQSRFRFDPGVFSRFGEELVPKPEQGIVELVKNSYDADALHCTVELKDTTTEGGEVRISDDGVGMDEEDIRNGFFIIGHSRKSDQEFTDKYNRQVAGDKGIGRLAALRLGTRVTVHTRPESEPGAEYRFSIDWSEYESVETVEEVSFGVEEVPTDQDHGTDVIIENLQDTITRRNVKYLSRQLILLADPFHGEESFSVKLKADEFESFERRINRKYFDVADYHLVADINDNGKSTAKLVDWRGEVITSAHHEDIKGEESPYDTVEAKFDFWWFKLKQESFSNRKATIKEVRNWLSSVGGVHFYHGDLRVSPYGEPGHDWLELNLARSRSPVQRPSTNNSIGRVKVRDLTGELKQKTDRHGFVEGQSFNEIRRFCQDTVSWLSRFLRKRKEKRRQREREEAPEESKEAKEKLDEALEQEDKDPDAIAERVSEFKNAKRREIKSLQDDLQLYRSLATAGVTSSTFAHQASTPLTQLSKIADTLRKQVEMKVPEGERSIFESLIDKIESFASSLSSFASMPLNLLKREKRRNQILDINDSIEEVLSMFDNYFTESKVNVIKDLSKEGLKVQGSRALVESIVTNLITNSIKAFGEGPLSRDERIFKVETHPSRSGKHAILKTSDSGPGIEGISMDEIWHPGRTTYPEGTGFGLTIVRDSVKDLGGDVTAYAHGELGGAEFSVSIPRRNPELNDEYNHKERFAGDGAPAGDRSH